MTLPKLILDTSACSRIARSPRRKELEAHLDDTFRRVMSVLTFWELLQQIEGGDGSHFSDDREVIRVAAGTSRPLLMLPNPLSFALETVLKRPRLAAPIPPHKFEQLYALLMKARTRDQLYFGVPVLRGGRQVRQFDPETVRFHQEAGERLHVERLKRAMRKKIPLPPPEEWARVMVKQVSLSLDDQQAADLGQHLDAAYQFDLQVWRMATAPNSNYNPRKHGNDWTDMQQTMYLCDPAMRLLTADGKLVANVAASHQADRVLYLPDYLGAKGLSL